jgi:hypothetical protein
MKRQDAEAYMSGGEDQVNGERDYVTVTESSGVQLQYRQEIS